MDELKTERIITPMPQSLVDQIDDYRFANRVPSRAEAIRQLTAIGMESAPILADFEKLLSAQANDPESQALAARLRDILGQS